MARLGRGGGRPVRGRLRPGLPEDGRGCAGNGDVGDGEGGLSASTQKRINSTRSNGLTAKPARRGAAPRGRGGGWAKDERKGGEREREWGQRVGEGQEEWERWGRKKRKTEKERERAERKGRDGVRGGVSSTSSTPASPPTPGRRSLSQSNQTPQPPAPLASTLPLSRQGAARPCDVPADPRASKLRLK